MGTIEPFNPANPSTWDTYSQRVKFYLEANAIEADNKKRAVFLSICGDQTFEIAKSLCAPNELGNTTFECIVELLNQHFSPKPSEIVQRCMFHKRDQRAGECVATLAELRKIAEFCNFGNSLETMLRDRLVCGVRDEALQRRLLSEQNLTFKIAFNTAVAAEATASHVSELRGKELGSVNKTDRKKYSSERKKDVVKVKKFFRCLSLHDPASCRWKDAECRFCSQIGHIERACLKKQTQTNVQSRPQAEKQSVFCER